MSKLKVAVFGCGGVIGQHMMISVPPDIEPLFVRKTPSPLAESLDLEDWPATAAWLTERRPDVIINLAGESRPDVVECDANESKTRRINVALPSMLAEWCDQTDTHLIQVSSQAALDPVNIYGKQKQAADWDLERCRSNSTIVRPTFVLGIRPFPAIGRENPAEQMLAGAAQFQVDDRFFSVSFAWDVAEILWETARQRPVGKIIHVGNPERLSRYMLAEMLNPGEFDPISQDALEEQWGIAPRPLDTTYADGQFLTPLAVGIHRLELEYQHRATDSIMRRCQELAAFLKIPTYEVGQKLFQGFGPLHNAVTWEFNHAGPPQTDEELLNWYRTTESYIWELTAYHCDPGFNYSGMCEGIITRILQYDNHFHKHVGAKRVLCLGDGVGTLTIKMREAGLEPVYHDLALSRTWSFALFRFCCRMTSDAIESIMNPRGPQPYYDAVCSLDFLEHVSDVESWVRTVWSNLKPGGLFCAQNAFAMGSGPDGAMPMHLACNDHFERDWDPLLKEIGFRQLAPQWYERPA